MADTPSATGQQRESPVALLTVTHNRIGEDIVTTAEEILGAQPLPCKNIAVQHRSNEHDWSEEIATALAALDAGSGVLLLTDVFGATPHNNACAAATGRHAAIVSGISLPMVLRLFNYAHQPLATLAEVAVAGGRRGIVDASTTG